MSRGLLLRRLRNLEEAAKPNPKHVYINFLFRYLDTARLGRLGDMAKEEEARQMRQKLEAMAGGLE